MTMTDCAHHWDIAEPDGQWDQRGRLPQLRSASKEFENHTPDVTTSYKRFQQPGGAEALPNSTRLTLTKWR